MVLHPQYIKDAKGNKTLVVIFAEEFNKIMDLLEDLEEITVYDEAKKNDDGERVLFSDYLKARKQKHA